MARLALAVFLLNLLVIVSDVADSSSERQLSVHGFRAPSFSPDGESILFSVLGNSSEIIYSLRIRNRRLERLIVSGKEATYAIFSPDGKQIIYASVTSGTKYPYLFSFDLVNKISHRLMEREDLIGYAPAFRSDGKEIFFLGRTRDERLKGQVTGVDLYETSRDGKQQRRLSDHNCFAMSSPSVNSQNGQVLVQTMCSADRWDWELLDPITLEKQRLKISPTLASNASIIECAQTCRSPKFSSDGTAILFLKYKNTGDTLYKMDVGSGATSIVFSKPGVYVSDFAVGGDRDRIVLAVSHIASHRGFGQELWLIDSRKRVRTKLLDFNNL